MHHYCKCQHSEKDRPCLCVTLKIVLTSERFLGTPRSPLITLPEPHIKMHWAFLPALYVFSPEVNLPVFDGLLVIQSGVPLCEVGNTGAAPGGTEESPGQAFI